MEKIYDKRKGPNKSWYKSARQIAAQKYVPDVEMDIEMFDDLRREVEPFRSSFVKFAAMERLDYEADIREELAEYYERKRMYQYNVKKWYRIINRVFKRDNYTCQYCGQVGGKLEADHIIPFSMGGPSNMENLTTSCRTCNRQKRDKSVEEFKEWKENNAKTR